jgi:hypothetical protein
VTVTGTNLLGLVEHLATWEAWDHSDATVDALPRDATGRVAWWQDATFWAERREEIEATARSAG